MKKKEKKTKTENVGNFHKPTKIFAPVKKKIVEPTKFS